jgi:hypothetical protein
MFQVHLNFSALRRVFRLLSGSVLSGVEVKVMILYSLSANDKPVCEVEMDAPDWLPVRPRLNGVWLRGIVSQALRRYFSMNRVVVKA